MFRVGTLLAVAGISLLAILFDFIGLDDFTPAGSLLPCTCSRCHPSARFCLCVDGELSCLKDAVTRFRQGVWIDFIASDKPSLHVHH